MQPALIPVEICPVCEGRARVRVLAVSQTIELVRCTACSLVYATGCYDAGFLAETYYGGRARGQARPGVDRKHLELARYDRISNGWLRQQCQTETGTTPRALDIGCNTGLLLDALSERGFETWGVERSPAATVARASGHEILNADVEAEVIGVDHTFELITVTHVLEHFHRPVRVLKWIAGHLSHGGRALIEVPNWGDLLRPLWGKYYRPLELGDHISFFTGETLSQAALAAGLKVEILWSGPRVAGLVFPNLLSAVDRLRALRNSGGPSVANREAVASPRSSAGNRWIETIMQCMDRVDPTLERVLGARWRGPNIVAFLSSSTSKVREAGA